MIRSLDYYDDRAEEMRIRSLELRMKEAEIRSMAEQAALSSHPVVPCVLSLPVESPLYPANRYLRFAIRVSKADGSFIDQETQESDQERIPLKNTKLITPTGKDTSEMKIHRQLQERVRNHITWDMPGHDQERPKSRGCGFIRASDKTIVYTACPRTITITAKRRTNIVGASDALNA